MHVDIHLGAPRFHQQEGQLTPPPAFPVSLTALQKLNG